MGLAYDIQVASGWSAHFVVIFFSALQTAQEFLAKKPEISRQLFELIGIHFNQNAVIPFLDCKF